MSLPFRVAHCPAQSQSSVSYLGTVLYAGQVPPTTGDCVPGAGSFIRPSAPGLSLGTSFPRAIRDKYAPSPSSSAPQHNTNEEAEEKSTFYGTASNFEIEVTSLAKIEDTFRNLGRLREAGLEWEGVSGAGEGKEREDVVRELRQLQVLNLSFSLIPSFEIVSEIVEGLTKLRTLSLNSNRFQPLLDPPQYTSLNHLTELQLNKTLVSWSEILLLSPSLPSLVHLQLGANGLKSLDPPPSAPTNPFPLLERLNLAENALDRWDAIASSLSTLPRLSTLILSSNALTSLSPSPTPSLTTLRHLSLSHNALESWSSIDALNAFPSLESLAVEGCGFGLSREKADEARMGVIARVKKLVELDGSTVTPIEREDAELFYLSSISKERAETTVEELERRHPRWKELSEHYDLDLSPSSAPPPPPPKATIKSKLIRTSPLPPPLSLSR
ncbi:hypothetical protein RQP46_006347 [Phenoliferia psychrophenolica]